MQSKIGRNDPCHCGSNLKYKKCCLNKDRQRAKPPGYVAIDPVASFLELNLHDSFDILRYNFHLEYSKIYAAWANDPIHSQNVFDTAKCEWLAIIAEERVSAIIPRYPRRFWIEAFRSMSLHSLFMVLGVLSINDLFEYISIGTLAINKFSSLENSGGRTGSSLEIENVLFPYTLEYAQANFASDAGKFLGAVNLLLTAQRSYRFAGKGGVLLQPQRAGLTEFPSFENFPKHGILIMPSVEFEKNDALQKSISIYENRRDQQREIGVTGFYQSYTGIHLPDASWWNVGTLGQFPEPPQTIVSYPNLLINIISHGYAIFPSEISHELKLLFPFADDFNGCFGLDFDSFRSICQALSSFIYAETAFAELQVKRSPMHNLEFTSRLSRRSLKAKTAPVHLFNLFSRAIFKAPRNDFVVALANGLNKEKQEKLTIAENFINKFTYHPTKLLFRDLTPWLFYPLDRNLLAVDFFAMKTFMELCLRTVTSMQGETSNVRAHIFEEQVKEFLIEKMNIAAAQIPITPGSKIKADRLDYGDVDFAFIWKKMLINLDMKSWQKSPEYLRGDFLAVDNRQKELQHQLIGKDSNIEKRGEKLFAMLQHSGEANDLLGVLSFLCVPHVEFLSKESGKLWYGNFPRVLTPQELAIILTDNKKLKDLTNFLND